MKKIIIITFLLAPLISFGIEPLIIKLDAANPSYTVPEGKVLIIEQIGQKFQNSDLYVHIDFISDGITNNLFFFCPDGWVEPFASPLKIPHQTTLMRGALATTYHGYTLFCLLVDPSDLYAHIDSQPGDMVAQNNAFSFDVVTASPRPVRISVEGSGDLATWQPADATVKKLSPDTYTISIPVEDEDTYFAKYTVRGINP